MRQSRLIAWRVPRTAARALLALVLLMAVPVFCAAKKEKDPEAGMRSVQGTVTSADDLPEGGAVVQLKNNKTLQIRSFITQKDGHYYFHGLSPDIDYELKAQSHGLSSATKTLSSFDNRKEATLNLKLEKNK